MIPKPSLRTGTVTPAWHQQLGKATANILSVLPPCRERGRRGGGKVSDQRQCERRRQGSTLRRIGGYFLRTCSPSRKLLIRQRKQGTWMERDKASNLPLPPLPSQSYSWHVFFRNRRRLKIVPFYSDTFAVFQAWHLVWVGVFILTIEAKLWWGPMVIKRGFFKLLFCSCFFA